MRLLYFDLTQGNRIGVSILFQHFKLKALPLIAKLKYRELFESPFNTINQQKKPSENERLSQRQMAPLVILYQLLKEEGYTQKEALDFCSEISQAVAVAFLQFNVPQIKKTEWEGQSSDKKKSMLDTIAKRFFNITSTNELKPNDEFTITVNSCSFAYYAKALGVPELGPIFCATDRYYFEHFQKEVQFNRSQTLAIEGLPCNFSFKWKG
jgi:hypothetical protein